MFSTSIEGPTVGPMLFSKSRLDLEKRPGAGSKTLNMVRFHIKNLGACPKVVVQIPFVHGS